VALALGLAFGLGGRAEAERFISRVVNNPPRPAQGSHTASAPTASAPSQTPPTQPQPGQHPYPSQPPQPGQGY